MGIPSEYVKKMYEENGAISGAVSRNNDQRELLREKRGDILGKNGEVQSQKRKSIEKVNKQNINKATAVGQEKKKRGRPRKGENKENEKGEIETLDKFLIDIKTKNSKVINRESDEGMRKN